MFDAETLLEIGLPNHVMSVWQVLTYLVLMAGLLLFQRVRICLLITYIFAYYLVFLIYWKDFIASGAFMTPFFLYVLSGIAIVALFAAVSHFEHVKMKRKESGS